MSLPEVTFSFNSFLFGAACLHDWVLGSVTLCLDLSQVLLHLFRERLRLPTSAFSFLDYCKLYLTTLNSSLLTLWPKLAWNKSKFYDREGKSDRGGTFILGRGAETKRDYL